MAVSPELRARLVDFIRGYRAQRGEKTAWETTFLQIEDEACELADAVAQELMAQSLAEQVLQEPCPSSACCPRCQRPATQEPEPEPRQLDTRRGPVGWQEPKHYCRHCRQAFFPSVPRAGD